MTATSFLIPAGGLLTAPVLAQALSTSGRGQLAAALAPGTLLISVAALGLPDALTFLVARRPEALRRAIGRAAGVTAVTGLIAFGVVGFALPFLSAETPGLAVLILIAAAVMLPSLLISLLRGAAIGANRWALVTGERIATTALRVILLGGLWLTGELDVFRAVIISAASPVLAGLIYLRLLGAPVRRPGDSAAAPGTIRELLSYGTRVWAGSIAEILLARTSQLLMVPLAGASELGILVVAITISDITFLLAQAVQSALFGVSSGTPDRHQVTLTSRLALLVTVTGAAALAGTLPFWIGPLFGAEFERATGPTVLLLISSIVSVPGLIASAGVSAWGRPGIRSTALLGTLILFVGVFVLLVPSYGAAGAGLASIAANLAMTGFLVVMAGRVMRVRPTAFFAVRPADALRLLDEARHVVRRMTGRG